MGFEAAGAAAAAAAVVDDDSLTPEITLVGAPASDAGDGRAAMETGDLFDGPVVEI